ncbi:hypothetical protein [Streptomyces sp. PT12]|uniref:hypothetical protein n=1 Tax=Streptomyces sp. PT12 TaxID=1510197 RepID=UPI0011BF2917|nr:hypothetical protein [Streptomyces sp. PT12]
MKARGKSIGLLVEDMADVVVDGRGSTLHYHGLQTAFAAIRSVSAAGVEDGRAYRVLTVPADSPYRVEGDRVT